MKNNFESINKLFELTLPDGWGYKHEENVYMFFNEIELQGIIQVSPYYNRNNIFDPTSDLIKEKKKYQNASIVQLSSYQAIHYGYSDQSDYTIHYYWITGNENVKLFCTLILNAVQEENAIDESYKKVLSILQTIKINPIDE